MPFFQYFETIEYNNTDMTNLTQRIAIPDKIKHNTDLFFFYQCRDTDTPENLAYDYYGKASDNWIILMMNDIVDPFHEWIMDTNTFEKYVLDKYGSIEEANATHHWEDSQGEWFATDTGGLVQVSNKQYEDNLNEDRRTIKILYPEYRNDLDNELKLMLKDTVSAD